VTASTVAALEPNDLAELAGVLRRAIALDPASLARFRVADGVASVLVRLPFGVLVSRSVRSVSTDSRADATVVAAELVAWLDGVRGPAPAEADARWRGGLPPVTGWRRIDTVPDSVVRDLVRAGASALKDAAAREGVPGAQPRASVADTLLDSVVLTVTADDSPDRAEITLRSLSALTRMGFLPPESSVGVDVAGRWIRVAAPFGSVFAERPGLGLGVIAR
jgi:hypothetical protein